MLSCPDVAVFVVGDDEETLKLFWMNEQIDNLGTPVPLSCG